MRNVKYMVLKKRDKNQTWAIAEECQKDFFHSHCMEDSTKEFFFFLSPVQRSWWATRPLLVDFMGRAMRYIPRLHIIGAPR